MESINRLPVEILQEVFDCVVEQWETTDQRRWTDLLLFHRSIRLVSKAWRRVAVHTPSIWRNVPLHRDYIEYARYALSRSGTRSLNVQTSDDKAFKENIDAERASRIVNLVVEDKTAVRRWITILLALPMERIQHLAMNSLTSSWDKPLQFMEGNTALRTLEATQFFHTPLRNRGCHAFLPSLILLRINDSAQEINQVLRSISAPSLKCLHIAVNDKHRHGERLMPITLIGMASFDSVREVIFQYAVVTGDILALLPNTPRVRKLRLSHSWRFQDSFDDLLERLLSIRGADVIAPELDTISFHRFSVSLNAVINLIQDRSAAAHLPGSPVREIRRIELSEQAWGAFDHGGIWQLRQLVEVSLWAPPPGQNR